MYHSTRHSRYFATHCGVVVFLFWMGEPRKDLVTEATASQNITVLPHRGNERPITTAVLHLRLPKEQRRVAGGCFLQTQSRFATQEDLPDPNREGQTTPLWV